MENIEINVQASEVWNFFQENADKLHNIEVIIAENHDTGHEVSLTNDSGYPEVCAYRHGIFMFTERCVNEKDCKETVNRVYSRYLFPVEVSCQKKGRWEDVSPSDITNSLCLDCGNRGFSSKICPKCGSLSVLHSFDDDEEFEDERDDMYDDMYEREDELRCAMLDFLAIVLDEADPTEIEEIYGAETVRGAVDVILDYLARDQCISVRRPTVYVDGDGNEDYVEYPYDDIGYKGPHTCAEYYYNGGF